MQAILDKKIHDTQNFSQYIKSSEYTSRSIQNILNMLPNHIKTFSFFRVRNNHEINILMPKPQKLLTYINDILLKPNGMINLNHNLPIYNPKDYIHGELQDKYSRFINAMGGSTSIAVNHTFHSFKDIFYFIFSEPINKEDFSSLYSLLNSISIAFYATSPIFKTTFKLPLIAQQQYINHESSDHFAPFSELIELFSISKSLSHYLLPLALHMPINQIASSFYRSRRTVEKNIDDLRGILDINSKFELCQFLLTYYLIKVKQWSHQSLHSEQSNLQHITI
ncbi:MAG: hypothetical protein EP298_00030 [Gammaproteobacteria bacterium]|nr:MAG: hypothetical protein EP298_00030 [Gammaproteobacteria bacterium]UTW43229.1 hypothetical protein KFE69_03545 [bacterium SCSIO 12844]